MDRLDAVTVFAAVVDQGSFAGAARKLSRTPAAVTRAVAELEASLNARLLNRTTRAVSLTEAGSHYLERARDLIAAHAAFAGAEPADATPGGTLHVTAPVNFGRRHLMPLVCAFLEKHPRVDARVLLLDRVVSLVEEGLDVGIRLGRLPDSTLRATRVGTMRMAVYGSPAYLTHHGTPATPADLARHHTIATGTINPVSERWTFAGGERTSQVSLQPRLTVNTTEAAADAAAAGIGLAYLMAYQAAAHVAAGRLVEVLPGIGMPDIPISIIQPAGRFTPAKVRVFIEEIGRALRQNFG